jgi:tryptophanyl-tRNA synthetase
MAADILIFNAHRVPVGRDQIQHIEMARDFGQRFNHLYGEHFTLPEAAIEANVATLPGLDGRKMSKSYDNVIPLFAPREQLRKLIYSIVTDSRAPGEPKDADTSNLFQLYRAFADDTQADAMRRAYEGGIAWGEAKQAVFERIDAEIAPMREQYEALMARPAHIEAVLRDGAARLRERYARPLLARLRDAVGLRDLSIVASTHVERAAGIADATPATFKQYREADGRFYFKLVRGERVLLQSAGFDAPRDAGQRIAALKQAMRLDDDDGLALGEGVSRDEVDAALAAMAEAAA